MAVPPSAPADQPAGAGGLAVTIGQHSSRGRKDVNQDCHGARLPDGSLTASKGIAVALADGFCSSAVGREAAEAAVQGFLSDYYCTPETWSVRTSARRVLSATNSWLHARTRRGPDPFDRDRGYVCTFTALILKSRTAHVFHVGDARVYRVNGRGLEQLTTDHRLVVSAEESYLSRALGVNAQLELDYLTVDVEPGDVFVLATDGAYEHLDPLTVTAAIAEGGHGLDGAARRLVETAFDRGSPDNITLQLVRVDGLPDPGMTEVRARLATLPIPPPLDARTRLDGYTIVRRLHASSRSHIYAAVDEDNGETVALKTPSVDKADDPGHLERFLLEEWMARRLRSAHVLEARPPHRRRTHLYTVMELVNGTTLRQWMTDHPRPDLETVRGIVEQIARGLRAFHRREILHQDLRPDNVMIDTSGTVKIIDFGSARVAGVDEIRRSAGDAEILGTAQYAAPEYFLGEPGSTRSDLFSLGVIAYELLSGRLPYGAAVARARTRAAQRRLRYAPLAAANREIPAWIDGVLARAVHPDPDKRHQALSELMHDLRHPPPRLLRQSHPPLLERDPLTFWKGLSLLLAVALVVTLLVLT